MCTSFLGNIILIRSLLMPLIHLANIFYAMFFVSEENTCTSLVSHGFGSHLDE